MRGLKRELIACLRHHNQVRKPRSCGVDRRGQIAHRRIDVVYHRISIWDVNVPASPAVVRKILGTVDSAIADGSAVYVHCWGGIGHTSTVVGCHLVRQGMNSEQALEKVLDIYHATMEKRHRRPICTTSGPHPPQLARISGRLLHLERTME